MIGNIGNSKIIWNNKDVKLKENILNVKSITNVLYNMELNANNWKEKLIRNIIYYMLIEKYMKLKLITNILYDIKLIGNSLKEIL